jgi:hypothetical protein
MRYGETNSNSKDSLLGLLGHRRFLSAAATSGARVSFALNCSFALVLLPYVLTLQEFSSLALE